MGIGWQIVWVVCGVATVVAAVPAVHHRWARYLGRAATGVLFVIGGALVHVTNLVTGVDYTRAPVDDCGCTDGSRKFETR